MFSDQDNICQAQGLDSEAVLGSATTADGTLKHQIERMLLKQGEFTGCGVLGAEEVSECAKE